MKKLKTYISRPKMLSFGNFGDELTIPLLERLFEIEAVPSPIHKADLLAVGSLLDAHSRATIRRKIINISLSIKSPLHIWGSGFILEDTDFIWPRPTVVHAVRGELSRAKLSLEVPVGDPGILAARLFNKRPTIDTEIALVPHFVDHHIVQKMSFPSRWKIVHPDGEPIEVIRKIASSEIVISSSLHGLIIADAFGIPAIWARSSLDLYKKSDFKFFDHASARRREYNSPLTYDELINNSNEQLISLATIADRDINSWSEILIDSFPNF